MKRGVVTGKPVLRIRVVLPSGYAVGPGKADLLSAIERLGSIAAAGRSMNMSYQRAWSLVDDLNRTFRAPLVEAVRGGARHGGAILTGTGRKVLARYRAIEGGATQRCRSELRAIAKLS